MMIGISLALTGGRGGGAGASLSPVPVLIVIGDSQSDGSNNLLADLPTTPIDYTGTDAGVKTWDIGSQALITRPAAGSEPAVMNPGSFATPVGWVREYTRRWRVANPATTLYVFQYSKSGTGFSTTGAASSDWTKSRSGSLYNTMLTEWTAFVAKLATLGLQPGTKTFATSLGWNSAITAPGGRPATELADNYATDFATFMSNIRSDILGATGIALIQRMQADKIGTYVYSSTIRANQATYVAGDAYSILVNCDGLQNVNPVAAGDQHYTAAGHITLGRYTYWSATGAWYPMADANLPLVQWEARTLENTLASSAYSTLYDMSGNGHALSQATSGSRPAKSTVGGIDVADFDGVDDHLFSTSPFITALSGYSFLFASKLATTANGYLLMEGSSSTGTPFNFIANLNAGGVDMTAGQRSDASVSASLGVIYTAAFDNIMNAYDVKDTLTAITGRKNGVAGATLTYTRGTITVDRICMSAIMRTTIGNWTPQKFAGGWIPTSNPDATYLANANAYRQREYLTP